MSFKSRQKTTIQHYLPKSSRYIPDVATDKKYSNSSSTSSLLSYKNVLLDVKSLKTPLDVMKLQAVAKSKSRQLQQQQHQEKEERMQSYSIVVMNRAKKLSESNTTVGDECRKATAIVAGESPPPKTLTTSSPSPSAKKTASSPSADSGRGKGIGEPAPGKHFAPNAGQQQLQQQLQRPAEKIPRVSVQPNLTSLDASNAFPFMQAGRLELVPEVFQKLKMDPSSLQLPDIRDKRYSVLSYDQVTRLSELMNEVVPIHGRGNFPTLEVKLVELVVLVRSKLITEGIAVKEIRLNGSGASSVLASNCNISYNDLDLIFTVDLRTQKHYERVKQAVLDSLLDLLPEGTSRKRMSSCTLKEAYVSKMVKVNDTDRWSLIALGNNRAKSVELKFVDTMKRKYEFSVDSFHIMLDTLFLFYDCAKMPISENFYPTVVGESVYGNFDEALFHLHKKLIATKHPEEIRGGGLLKYCNLLVKNYRPAVPEQVKSTERYMCSRFFIDFPDLNQQHNKLVKFLDNHFQGDMEQLKYDYLMILHQVVDESTVCLMGHERRQTLALIEDLSCSVYVAYEDNSNNSGGYHHHPGYHHANPVTSTINHHHHHQGSGYSSPGGSSGYASPCPAVGGCAVGQAGNGANTTVGFVSLTSTANNSSATSSGYASPAALPNGTTSGYASPRPSICAGYVSPTVAGSSGYSSPTGSGSEYAGSLCWSSTGGGRQVAGQYSPAGSTCSSGQYSPMSTSNSSPSLSPKPVDQLIPDTAAHVVSLDFSVPPPKVLQQQQQQQQHSSSRSLSHHKGGKEHHQQQNSGSRQHHVVNPAGSHLQTEPAAQPLALEGVKFIKQVNCGNGSQIPTYEIITSCQPRVMYSNGYYFTSFTPVEGGMTASVSTGGYTASATSPTSLAHLSSNNNSSSSSNSISSNSNSNNNNSSNNSNTYVMCSTSVSQSAPCLTCSCSCRAVAATVSPHLAVQDDQEQQQQQLPTQWIVSTVQPTS